DYFCLILHNNAWVF
nr:immunoglobulin light chain junction region [Macaca mulatta]